MENNNGNNNNNMSYEEKLSKFLEEMKKIGNIHISEDVPDFSKMAEKNKNDSFFDMVSKYGMNKVKEAEEFVKKMKSDVEKGFGAAAEKKYGSYTVNQPETTEETVQEQVNEPIVEEETVAEPECCKEPEQVKAPSRDDIVGMIYKGYSNKTENTEKFERLIIEFTANCADYEKERIRRIFEAAVNAEKETAFRAGFDAAKELYK